MSWIHLLMTMTDELRRLPSVDEALRAAMRMNLAPEVVRLQLVEWIRTALNELRQRIMNGESFDEETILEAVIESTRELILLDAGRQLRPVINCTGIVLHTNLGRAPLAEVAIQRIQECAGYVNVEMNLQTGKRNARGERVVQLLRQLTGAEDVAVVNNCAAATMLALQTVAAGREVIVSRGQLVEIGGGYRLPEVFTASGALLKEVGTTNRTYIDDYEAAIGENTAAIIRVHRSNFSQCGFVTEPDLADIVSLGRTRGIVVIDDLGSGSMHGMAAFGLHEPTVPASVAAGADLVLFSGDKLFGGPQSGILAGRQRWVAALHHNPLMRAMRVDKLILAALEATAEIHLSGNALSDLPLLQMLTRTREDVHKACESVRRELNFPNGIEVSVEPCLSEAGGGSMPGAKLESFGLRLAGMNAECFCRELRIGSPAVLGRIHEDAVLLDLRAVADHQRDELVKCINRAVRHCSDKVRE